MASTTTGSEDHLFEFLKPEFDQYFSNSSDIALFIKMCSADGLVPLFIQLTFYWSGLLEEWVAL